MNVQRFNINLTMSDIDELQERIINAEDGEQEIVFEWRMTDDHCPANVKHAVICSLNHGWLQSSSGCPSAV